MGDVEKVKKSSKMRNWDPKQYLRFKNERTQPSIDLVSRVRVDNPSTIIDIGCGPGNSTQVLHQRWPNAEITGLDNSSEMIETARRDYPNQKWLLSDASKLELDQTYDIVFSNAALQWIPDHDILIPRFFQMVNPRGSLAVQVPAIGESLFHKALLSVSLRERWSRFTSGCEDLLNYRTAEYYYNILFPLTSEFDLWETTYHDVMASHGELIEWHKSTGMRPYLERLPDDGSRKEFEGEILTECKHSYPIQKDSKVLYPFKRIFFVAYRL